ncbi:TlpA family protein disulfide reductase [Deinococcus antarcticus]|uniref:TlpA family protein disulfide reductase n=1 Tax=Deinococcus antarcticus TaxID=1298767 RepID=A0ABV8AC26_9DEIO
MNRFITPAILLGLVGFLAYGLLNSDPNRDAPNALLGKAAPMFTLTDTKGTSHDLASLKGQGPIVVNFWATWCGPCHDEAPLFSKISNMPSNVKFLGVLYNDPSNTSEKFAAQYGLKYPNLNDPGSKVAMQYGIGKIPVTYIIDTQGKVTYKKEGPVMDENEFKTALRKAGGNL